jgi:5'-deoxynucleotidase YfbR-like HD superfamily hydrolase
MLNATIEKKPVEEGWIQSYTGKVVYPLEITKDQLIILDIAHALALSCRFGGHVKHHYSVAQHSVHCMEHAKRLGYGKLTQFACLMHDTPEAYLSDIAGPIKKRVSIWYENKNKIVREQGCYKSFSEVEDVILSNILTKYRPTGYDETWFNDTKIWQRVKDIDYKMLVTEGRDLLIGGCKNWGLNKVNKYHAFQAKVPKWTPEQAERKFLDAFITF